MYIECSSKYMDIDEISEMLRQILKLYHHIHGISRFRGYPLLRDDAGRLQVYIHSKSRHHRCRSVSGSNFKSKRNRD